MMQGLFDLTGRVALVTGSSRGIGRAIAERMAEAGAKVVISSRKPDACESVVSAIHAAHGGDRAIAVPATLGGPLADFAYHVMIWRIAPDVFRGLAGLEVADLGIPSEKEYVAEYCRATDRDGIRDWDFYIIFSMFRIAAILQGIARPAIDGTAADANAASVGRLARLIADQAWSIAGRLAR